MRQKKIIQKRLEKKIEEEISNTQAGFRKNCGTRDQLFNLKMIIQKCREYNVDLYMCFIDYSKAFDCVSHEKLWKVLNDMGFPKREIHLIKELYRGQQSAVRTSCGTTEWFRVEKGVRQGCILSPYLFNAYTEAIMRQVEEDGERGDFQEPNIQGHRIKDLRYADDTTLMSNSNNGLEKLTNSVKTHSEAYDLHLNVKKTKVMKTDKSEEKCCIKVNGETLEAVNKYEYLGSTITENGDGITEIKKRLAIAADKLGKMKTLWKGQDARTKLRIIRACVFPTATYGCETWTSNKTVSKIINAFEMKCYRRILRVSWTEHRTNESIRKELGVPEGWLENYVLKLKLKYFGHLKRHEGLGRTILEGKMNGKRTRGRPRKQWEKEIQQALGMTVTEAGRMAKDRQQYRKTIGGTTSRISG